MNMETDITQNGTTPVLPRRNVVVLAAAGSVVLLAGAAPRAKWEGDGTYQVEGWAEGPAGLYHISRHWSDMDKTWLLFGAYLFEGHRVAPRVIVDPILILRKVGEVLA